MKRLIKKVLAKLPNSISQYLLECGKRIQDRVSVKQRFTQIKCGAFKLQSPKNHLLVGIYEAQPYRDLWVGIVSKYVSAKYPDGTIIDIGANIGDTAAIIASYSKCKLILVEASEYFFEVLARNVKQFPNEVVLKRTMISNGRAVSGSLHYRGGTAYFSETADGKAPVKTERLADVADDKTHFVKVDTDGFDVEILSGSLDWLAVERPAIVFENEIRNNKALLAVNGLLDELKGIGYEHFTVWDDPGLHIVSTSCVDVLKDLNRYLLKLSQGKFRNAICNYDILCIHRNDGDVYESVRAWYETY
jgi:FkbM family methyltransferase